MSKTNNYKMFRSLLNLFNDNTLSLDTLNKKLNVIFNDIADNLDISIIKVNIITNKGFYEDEQIKENHILYHDGIGGKKFHSFQKRICNNVTLITTFYSKEECEFTISEINKLDIINNIIFTKYSSLVIDKIIEHSYKTDLAVGIPNNAGIARIGQMLQTNNTLDQYNVIFMNLKNFKVIAKLVGMKNINEMFKRYTLEIRSQLENKEVIGRLGGDNFVIYVKKENTDKILKLLDNTNVEYNGEIFNIKARVGLYEINKEDTSGYALENASTALNIARANKSNYLKFNDEIKNRLFLAKEITYAFPISLQNKEFKIYFQPKVNMSENKLNGAEALVRWEGQKVGPAVFVPILEEENLIEELDFYVLETVCQNIRNWIDEGIEPVKISTNISRNNLIDPKLVSKIVNIIKKYDIDPKYIEIEITETAAAQNSNDLYRVINELQSQDINISIDDFGTGSTALNLLTDVSVDTIKIDKTFIDKYKSKNSGVVIKNTVHMINELGINIIAEGVEEKEQVDFLQDIGCPTAQGYYYDKPLTEEDFTTRLKNKVYKKAR